MSTPADDHSQTKRRGQSRAATARLVLIYLIAALVLLGTLVFRDTASELVTVLTGGAVLLYLGLAVPVLTRHGRVLLVAASVVGHVLLLTAGSGNAALSDSPIRSWLVAWGSAVANGAGFTVLVLGIPFAALFVRAEDSLPAPGPVGGAVGASSSGSPLTLPRVAAIHFMLSLAVNVGSLWVTAPLYDAVGAERDSRFRTVSAAHSSTVTVSPLDPVVNISLVLAGVSYVSYVFMGALLGVLILAVSTGLELWARRGLYPGERGGRVSEKRRSGEKQGAVRAILFRAFVLVAAVISGKLLLDVESEVVETGVLLVGVSMILIVGARGGPGLLEALKAHPGRLQQLVQITALILAALFLAGAVEHSAVSEALTAWILGAAELPTVLAAAAIVALTAALAAVGVHMLLTIGSIGALVGAAELGISAPAFAGLLILSYLVAMNLSPLVPFTIASAELNGGRPSIAAVRAHAPVWILVGALGSVLIALVG